MITILGSKNHDTENGSFSRIISRDLAYCSYEAKRSKFDVVDTKRVNARKYDAQHKYVGTPD